MACLARIRESFIEMDMALELMEEAYATFIRFEVDVPKDDIDRVDTLRYNFTNMVHHVSFHFLNWTVVLNNFGRLKWCKRKFAKYKDLCNNN